MTIPQPQQIYLIELCSGERRRWRYQGADARGAPWWRDMESGKEFSESSLMYAWHIVGPETPAGMENAALPADLYRLIAEQMAEALILADVQGTIRLWNPAATTLFGFAADAALGASLDLIIPERLRAAHWSAFHAAMARGAVQHGAKARLTRALHADGRRLYVEMSFAVLTDGQGKVRGSLAVAREGVPPPPR